MANLERLKVKGHSIILADVEGYRVMRNRAIAEDGVCDNIDLDGFTIVNPKSWVAKVVRFVVWLGGPYKTAGSV